MLQNYAVGLVGSNQATMDTIASAGGTMQGIQVGNGNASAELLAALKKIQGSQVACTFQMPTMGSMGETIDPTLVNVSYTPGKIMLEGLIITLKPPRPIAAVDVARLTPKLTLAELRQPLIGRIEEAIEKDPF